jgi:hypothetical protein
MRSALEARVVEGAPCGRGRLAPGRFLAQSRLFDR